VYPFVTVFKTVRSSPKKIGEKEMTEPSKIGGIEWVDLTVPNAKEVKEFYCNVLG